MTVYVVDVQLALDGKPTNETNRVEVVADSQEEACKEALLLVTSITPALYSGHKCVKFGVAPDHYRVVTEKGPTDFVSFWNAKEAMEMHSANKVTAKMYDVVNGKEEHLYHYITEKQPELTMFSQPRMLQLED